MKGIVLTLAAIFTLGIAISAAAEAEETVKVTIGKRVTADGGRISIKFLAVVEDSRCPANATCIWAGNAAIRIAVSKGNSAPTIVELNTLTEPRNQILYGYEFELKDLEPQKGESGSKSEMTAVVSVRRK